ncbi:MAG: helix-turn-helix domain-containing protein [Anaerovoracaceae bacterium]
MCETIIARVERLLKEEGKQAKDLCDACGISYNTFSNWKRRNTDPGAKYICDIAKFLDVSEKYILNGESVEYFINQSAAEIANEIATRPELQALMDSSRKVSKESVEAINNMILSMQNK